MVFVYVHVLAFAFWMLVLERSLWPTLTLVVSLEAIFLSTFVLIGQNRQAAVAQAKADHDFVAQELELRTNTELTRDIHTLLEALEDRLAAGDQGPTAGRTVAPSDSGPRGRGWSRGDRRRHEHLRHPPDHRRSRRAARKCRSTPLR